VNKLNPTAEKLFAYLGDVIYSPSKARLNVDELPVDFQKFGRGLVYFAESVKEANDLAKSLSKGILNVPIPPQTNNLAANLKDLHATLKHLTWQTQQVAQGDYKQRVEFMGEFADAFNSMVEQLERQRSEIIEEMRLSKLKSQALQQTNDLFEAVSNKIPQWIVVVRRESGEWLYTNHEPKDIFPEESHLMEIKAKLAEKAAEMSETAESYEEDIYVGDCERYFSMAVYSLRWHDRSAVAFMLKDVSLEREYIQNLENAANLDHMTQIFNRRFGMKTADLLIKAKEEFVLAFADIDNLKYVNDKLGHLEGDQYILCVVDHLKQFSPDAILSRLGGDEFMLLLVGGDMEFAMERMETVRDSLVKLSNTERYPYNLSISYGVIAATKQNQYDLSELLAIVDDKMYTYKRERKKNGRNEE
jgi:diguanylate cyclase (GGDEF)-like protein